jgi:2-oxoisovalerate dehydrogenase E1 component
MASDDRRSDDSANARSHFTTRTFLMPDDEPGDGAAAEHEAPEAAFGTGGVDDDTLDAVVAGGAPAAGERPAETSVPEAPAGDEPTFVWAAPEVPESVPETDDAPEVMDLSELSPSAELPTASFSDSASEALPVSEPSASEEAVTDAEPFEAGELVTSLGEPTGDAEASSEPVAIEPPVAAAPADAASEVEEAASSVDAGDGAPESVADAQEPAADRDAAGTDEQEDVTAAPVPSAGAVGDAAEAEAPSAPDLSVDEGTEATTAAVDEAFEMQADVEKAETAAASEIEGTIDVEPLGPEDFDPDDLRGVLRTMMLSRRLDQKMLNLLKQGKGFFHIGSAGHEASQTAVAREFRGGEDWFCFYYRDLATALTVGITPDEVLRAHFGKAADVFGGGRQMPEHFGKRELNVMSTSSSVAAQYLPAVGFALACKREDGEVSEDAPGRAVYASGGEGSTSQGAFHEALNWAAREALPVLFHIQDNKYAISVPVEEQTAGGSIWHLLGGYSGLQRIRYDGTDFFQSAAAARAAMAHIRAGRGPVALHADLVRLLPHSSSDDHRKYREQESIDADAARDPLPRFAAQLVEAGVMTDEEVDALRDEVAAEVDRIAREVAAEPDPDPAEATTHVYYEGDDTRHYEVEGETGDLVVMVDAINHALAEEMERDDRVLVYGEDVGGGKGGVFTATRGLTERFGRDRCFNSPLAENSIIGSAVGLAGAGYKPVVEIQFADYIWPGMQSLRNQVASMRYRSKGTWTCPMVLRVPTGGYIHGGLCHSQNVEALFAHFPGLHVVLPSNAADAKGLLKAAIRGEDPVLFLEHKALYRQGPARRPEPHADYLVPLGKAAVARPGTDLTIVTWGAIVYKALNVAKALEKEGVSVEVIDLRSILPLDTEAVLRSVKKTGRALVAYEDHEFMGFGAEVAAQVSDAAFGYLDAPVKRVAGAFSSIPYADALEKVVLPQDDDVLAAARSVLEF